MMFEDELLPIFLLPVKKADTSSQPRCLDSAALITAQTEPAVFCIDSKIVLRSLCPRSFKAFENLNTRHFS